MKLSYHASTDSLYIAAGNLVGIDIDSASNKVDLQTPILSRLPGEVQTIAA